MVCHLPLDYASPGSITDLSTWDSCPSVLVIPCQNHLTDSSITDPTISPTDSVDIKHTYICNRDRSHSQKRTALTDGHCNNYAVHSREVNVQADNAKQFS